MQDGARGVVDPMDVVRSLTALPHRGATTAYERRAAEILSQQIGNLGVEASLESFFTAKTYVWVVWWLVGGLVAGLLLAPHAPWLALLLAGACAVMALLYFDWRWSPAALLPPQARSENVIGRRRSSAAEADPESAEPRKKLILMAHYDSAPVSLLYLPKLVQGFRRSLLINLGLIAAAALVVALEVAGLGQPLVTWLRWPLAIYFVVQAVTTALDYLRHGYTNGAADNATGTAVALATAAELWADPPEGWDIELVLTGAEEATMSGSAAYWRAHGHKLDRARTFVLNFDNVGAGKLKVITRTGSISSVVYENPLSRAALAVAAEGGRFADIEAGSWHTGDFDSLIFARSGIHSLTISAQDEAGLIPHLHRPEDTIDNIDADLPAQAVAFACATVRRLAAG